MSSGVKVMLAALGALVSAVVLVLAASDYYTTILWWELRRSMFWLLPLLGFVLAALALAIWGDAAESSGDLLLGPIAAGLLLVLGFFGWLWYAFSYHEYQQGKVYAASIEILEDPVPAFGQRAPYGVAVAQAPPNLGEIPGNITDTSYLPEGDRYTSLVERRGAFSGYQVSLSQQIPLTGRG
ncbi:MAG: hypothetical protein M3O70_08185, partial [Actinomycetota bacterium]|nr:hypothetical protein [Actinomycetota bacterium]